MKWRQRLRIGLLLAFGIGILLAVAPFALESFREEEKQLLTRLRKAVKDKFPEQSAKASAIYGLHPFPQSPDSLPPAGSSDPAIILVHGLDDPGKVWTNLAPALVQEKLRVFILTYPNDQPIRESAQLFADELSKLIGVQSVSIVAHSMGGLVARELLTNPEFAYAESIQKGQTPAIVELIMVGTPNHGSGLARFRALAEYRDLWAGTLNGNGNWLMGVVDGMGEAKIDLLPDSQFLGTLNARPQPQGVRLSVIAGLASPWEIQAVQDAIESAGKKLPKGATQALGELQNRLEAVSGSVGDGLVTVNSARLEGVPLQTVPGTHLSMIRNITRGSDRVPPAVPLIVQLLKQAIQSSPRDKALP